MSQDQARLVIERMKTDEAFRERILAAEDVAERLRLAEAEGYEVSEEDVAAVSVELSDAELADVAAGSLCWAACDEEWGANCTSFADLR